MDPEKVIAPTAAPIDISIKLASLILPTTPLGGNKELEKKNMVYIWGIEMQTKEIA